MSFGEAVCAYDECGLLFDKQTHNQRYHDQQCKRAVENLRRREMVSDIARAVASTYSVDDDVDRDVYEQIEYLRTENRRLGRAADRYKQHRNEILEAVHTAAQTALSKMEIAPVKPPKKLAKNNGSEEVCNPWWGDWQVGKRTPSYNSEIAVERIALLGDKISNLTEIQRSAHPINHARVFMLGDMVEGEDIFPGQHWMIDDGLFGQVVRVTEMMVDGLRRLLSEFETVHVTAVTGNHGHVGGRNNRYYHPDTNFDRMVYRFAEMMLSNDKRITFNITQGQGEANYYAIDQIGNYSTLLCHGDQFPAPTALAGYVKKVNGWRSGAMDTYFDDVAIGHWHQNTKMTIGDCVLRINGTPESDNLYAQKVIGAKGRPSQHLQFVSPKKGMVTAEYDLYLDR